MRKKILIYDDDPRIVERWSSMIKSTVSNFDVMQVEKDKFEEAVILLEKRRLKARAKMPLTRPWGDNLFDNIAILVIDFDLFNPKDHRDSNKQMYLTGEEIAYLVRCYSRCGLIIGLNQFGMNSFDLTLKGHPESYADLNLGDRQIANPGLWHESWSGFRPWSWPLLPKALGAFEARVKELLKCLDKPILTFLGFSSELAMTLPRSTVEFIAGTKEPGKVTFKEFVHDSENGLRRKDKVADIESTARIAAARVAKWLERLVLSGQDILVDAPHLVFRYPSLLKGHKQDPETWDKTATFKSVSALGIRYDKLKEFSFKEEWLSRPAWFWQRVSNCKQISEVAYPWKATEKSEFVFCEDISRFLPKNAAREFVADLPSSFVCRFVVDPRSKYGKRFAKDVTEVSYRPQVRFSL